jgi:DNA-binding response OmpR family regulator
MKSAGDSLPGREKAPNLSSVTASETPVNAGKQRILIVDDNRAIQHTFRRLLEERGYDVLLSADVQESMDHVVRTHPDLVLLDVHLGLIDGCDVLEKLRAAASQVPVIMISASFDADDRRRSLALGAVDYLEKLCPAEVFIETIGTALRGRVQRQAPEAPS